MKIVIDIPDTQYEYLAKIATVGEEPLGYFERVIMRGTPLPKGHGRLGDLDALEKEMEDYSEGAFAMTPEFLVKHAPTIIEAAKGGE